MVSGGEARRPAADALHRGRREDRRGRGSATRDGAPEERRDGPPDGHDRREGRRRESDGGRSRRSPSRRGNDRDGGPRERPRGRPSGGGRSPPPVARRSHDREERGLALVPAEHVEPHADEVRSSGSDGSPAPSQRPKRSTSTPKELPPQKRRRRRSNGDQALPPGGQMPPLVVPAGHFDYTPLAPDDAVVNWSSWLLKFGMQDGLAPVAQVVNAVVQAGFWSPAMVAGRTMNDFLVALRRTENPIASHGSFEFLVERIWRLSSANGPKVDSAQGMQYQTGDGQVNSLLKAIHGRAKPEKNGVFRQAPADDDEVGFDLGTSLRTFKVTQLPVHWFADLKRLGFMSRALAKAVGVKGPVDKQTVFLADTAFEEWIPPWVGVHLQPAQKAALLKAWRQRMGQDGGMALSCILNFWLSHAVVGTLSFHTVMAHALLLIQLLVERGTSYTVSYARALQLLILNEVNAGNAGPIDEYLVQLNRSVLQDVDMQVRNALAEQLRVKAEAVKGDAKARGRGVGAAADSLSGLPADPKGHGKGKKGGRGRPYICFDHDPAKGKICPRGQACSDEHVDTKQKEGRERFDSAFAKFKAHKSGSKKKQGE